MKHSYPEHYAPDLNAAIELAEKLKKSGEYDLFRGQKSNFPILPSICRPQVNVENATNRLDQFARWVNDTPDLSSLHNNHDGILAVAQHYGIPTPLLDFSYSPKIAGYFASDDAKEGDIGTIICLNRKRFSESWHDINERFFAQNGHYLAQLIEIDVPNLWRLQAQQGAFLRCHVDPHMLEMFSFILHIYFPQTGASISLDRSQIYPEERSHLEVLLDQYLLIETYDDRFSKLSAFADHVISADRDMIEEYYQSLFLNAFVPPVHCSWQSQEVRAWLTEPDELIGNLTGNVTVTLTLPSEGVDVACYQAGLESLILTKLAVKRSEVSEYLKFDVLFPDGSVALIDTEKNLVNDRGEGIAFSVSDMCNVIYSGMRYLPYTNANVARALARYLTMLHFGVEESNEHAEGVWLDWEGGSVRGTGFCVATRLEGAIRDDFMSFANPAKLNAEGNYKIRDLLAATHRVQNAYVFDKFVDLFVNDLIPSQAVIAVEGLVIGLNPMRIYAFDEH